MKQSVKVVSSAIDSVAYDSNSHLLSITFNSGNTYDYPEVPEAEFKALVTAKSIGQYFNYHIKSYSIRRKK